MNNQVVDPSPTQTYLDDALFSDLIEFDRRNIRPGKTKLVMDWLVLAAYKRVNCATIVLDSLVETGILDMEPTLFGRKYPLLDHGKLSATLHVKVKKLHCNLLQILCLMTAVADPEFCKGRSVS